MVGYTSQMGKQATSNFEAKKKSRVLWNNPTLTTTFCDPWVDEIQGGHRNKYGCFSLGCWTKLVSNFISRTGKDYDKDQLKIRWDVLMIDWNLQEKLKLGDTGLVSD